MYHEPERPPPWWLEALVLTRAVFGVLLWPLLALVGVVAAIVGLVFAFTAHWGFGLLALALIAGAVGAFAWWENRHFRPQQ